MVEPTHGGDWRAGESVTSDGRAEGKDWTMRRDDEVQCGKHVHVDGSMADMRTVVVEQMTDREEGNRGRLCSLTTSRAPEQVQMLQSRLVLIRHGTLEMQHVVELGDVKQCASGVSGRGRTRSIDSAAVRGLRRRRNRTARVGR